MNWWRAHHGISNDTKIALVAKMAGARRCEAVAVWVTLLDIASQAEDRGSVDGFDVDEISLSSEVDQTAVLSIIDSMRVKGMLDSSNRLTAWDKRQPKREREDDTAADRKRRERERHTMSHHVTPCHTQIRGEESREETTPPTPLAGGVTRTSRKRNYEQIGKALGPERTRWFCEWWSVFPCKEGKLPSMDAFERQVTDAGIWEKCRVGAVRYAAKARADPTMKLKYGQGWLNDARWDDEEGIPRVSSLPRPESQYRSTPGTLYVAPRRPADVG